MTADSVPQRGDGFDSAGSSGDQKDAQLTNQASAGLSVQSLRGMNVSQLMETLHVSEDKAHLVKDGLVAGGAALRAVLAQYYLREFIGNLIGDDDAGNIVAGILGGAGGGGLGA